MEKEVTNTQENVAEEQLEQVSGGSGSGSIVCPKCGSTNYHHIPFSRGLDFEFECNQCGASF